MRYVAMVGPNTKQLWLYDEQDDVYIDPPLGILNALPDWGGDPTKAENELERIANDENPDWLHDEDHRFADVEI